MYGSSKTTFVSCETSKACLFWTCKRHDNLSRIILYRTVEGKGEPGGVGEEKSRNLGMITLSEQDAVFSPVFSHRCVLLKTERWCTVISDASITTHHGRGYGMRWKQTNYSQYLLPCNKPPLTSNSN